MRTCWPICSLPAVFLRPANFIVLFHQSSYLPGVASISHKLVSLCWPSLGLISMTRISNYHWLRFNTTQKHKIYVQILMHLRFAITTVLRGSLFSNLNSTQFLDLSWASFICLIICVINPEWYKTRTNQHSIPRKALHWEVSVWQRSRSSAYKLDEHSQQGLVKDGNHLGGSRGGSSKQIRMASERVPMHLISCGLNQGQGCQTARIEYSQIDIGG